MIKVGGGVIGSIKTLLFSKDRGEGESVVATDGDDNLDITDRNDSVFDEEIKPEGCMSEFNGFSEFIMDKSNGLFAIKTEPALSPTTSTCNEDDMGARLFRLWSVEKPRNAPSEVPRSYSSLNISRDRKDMERLVEKNPRCVLELEINHLIKILSDLESASWGVPQSCKDELAKGIAEMSAKFELSNLSEEQSIRNFDGFTAALITMDHIGFSKENNRLKVANDKISEELREISTIHNKNRSKAQFSSFAYDELFKILHEKTEQVIKFIKSSPLYDIEYEALNLKSKKHLMEKFKSVRDLALASYDDLNETHGVGQSTIAGLHKAFEELNLPTVFVTKGNLAVQRYYESEIKNSFFRIDDFNVPYSICGKRNSTYVLSPYSYYLSFERKDRCDENGTKLTECSEIKGW